MPNATIYIRGENWDKWQKVADKSLWVNTLLANSDDTSKYGVISQTPVGPTVTVLSETLKPESFIPKPPDPDLGYPCCNKRTPCKHWQWNSDKQLYINTLTGKEREPD
jgi:hypothetical protein